MRRIRRVRAACDARDALGLEGVAPMDRPMVFARSDARQAEGLEEALARAEAFAAAGADALFIDALVSEEEMAAFAAVAPGLPKMANNLEGGGKSPIVKRARLAELGFSIVAYPLSLLGVSIAAMQGALEDLAEERIPEAMPSLAEIRDVVEWPAYDKVAEQYRQ